MMWARVVELMLGLWLAISPLILRDSITGSFTILNALSCSLLVVLASCFSYWEPTRHARAVTALVGLWLAGRAYVIAPHPAPPPLQNEVLVGLLLLMFAIVPNEADRPPRSWRPFVADERTP